MNNQNKKSDEIFKEIMDELVKETNAEIKDIKEEVKKLTENNH